MSDPAIRMRIRDEIRERGVLRAATLGELKLDLGMEEVSTTQFGKALRSLHYKYGQVRLNRPHSVRPHYGPRIFEVSYQSPPTRTATLTGAAV